MADLRNIFSFIPEIRKPDEKKVGFNTKLKWTAIILGTDFGSIISLGIGPIVTASIILQLLKGAEIIKIDTTTDEGKKFFQGIQKLLVLFFIIFEAVVFVFMQGLQALPGLEYLLVFQLILGGIAIFYMDELTQKWGFGSGVSLFIAAGVSWRLITSAFQFIDQQGRNCLLGFKTIPCSGKVLVLIQSVINRFPIEFLSALATIIATIIIFLAVV